MRPTQVKKSAYSKMYLVTLPVYNKLLSCIDEREKQNTEELNVPEKIEERPSDKLIEQMNSDAMEEKPEEEEIENVPEPTFTETNKIFGTGEGEEGGGDDFEEEMEEKPPAPIIRERQIVENPLRTPCEKRENIDVIREPEVLYTPPPQKVKSIKPTFKIPPLKKHNPTLKKGILIPKVILNRIDEPPGERISKHQQLVPKIILDRVDQDENLKTVTPVQAPKVRIPTVEDIPEKFTKHQCSVCLKYFSRKNSLKRHVDHVHKNLEIISPLEKEPLKKVTKSRFKSKTEPIKSSALKVKFVPDDDDTMIEDYRDWSKLKQGNIDSLKKSTKRKIEDSKKPNAKLKVVLSKESADLPKLGKRTSTQAGFKPLRSQTKSRPSDDYFQSWA